MKTITITLLMFFCFANVCTALTQKELDEFMELQAEYGTLASDKLQVENSYYDGLYIEHKNESIKVNNSDTFKNITGFVTEQFIVQEIGLLLAVAILFITPLWKIFSKAGFSPWNSLLVLIPPAGLGLLIVVLLLNFRKWTTDKEV